MLKKTITYTDYNGVERKEDFYFNLSKAEVMEMNLSNYGGLAQMLQKIIDAHDSKTIIETFKDIILKAYGVKSVDGREFVKVDENGRPLSVKFSQTEAYSILFMELSTNSEAASEFVNGILPKDM